MKYFSIILLFLNLSCAENDSGLLSENATVSAVFSKSESEDLQKLLDNFTEKVCSSEKKDVSEPSECFKSYLQNINQTSPSSGYVMIPITVQEQEQLLAQISEETFNQIWDRTTTSDGTFLSINIQGKYIEFLDDLSKEKSEISEYKDAILSAGTIGASAQANVILFPEKYDVTDIRIRLLLTIHFITINGNYTE